MLSLVFLEVLDFIQFSCNEILHFLEKFQGFIKVVLNSQQSSHLSSFPYFSMLLNLIDELEYSIALSNELNSGA